MTENGDLALLPLSVRKPLLAQLARFALAAQHGEHVSDHDALEGLRQAVLATSEDSLQQSLGLPGAEEVTAADAVAGLRLLPGERWVLDLIERDLIEAALDRGETWESLGAALGGRSRQAMQQRYRRLGGSRTWPTRRPGHQTSGQ